MLVLSRKLGETIVIDERISVTVQRIAGSRVTLSIEAPAEVRVLRSELSPRTPEPRCAKAVVPAVGKPLPLLSPTNDPDISPGCAACP